MIAASPMDRDLLAAGISTVTGGLRPGSGVSADDLAEVRRLVAHEILRGRADALTPPTPFGDTSSVIAVAPEVADEPTQLASLADSAIAELASDPNAFEDVHVYRRAQPVLTPQLADSVPPWAGGWAVERTLGPFVDAADRRYWFDIRRILRQVQVIGAPGGVVLAVIPHAGVVSPATRYTLPKGTVWIRSKLIAADAPEGAFTGLLISGGALKLSAASTIDTGRIVVGSAAQFELSLKLQPSAGPSSPASGPGADARACNVALPATVNLRGAAAGTGEITAAADGSLTAYGTTAALTFAGEPAHYESTSHRILVPYTTTASAFSAAAVQSNLFQPGGNAPISAAFWALSTAIPLGGPTQLGPAQGIGGLGLHLAPGLSAQWSGLGQRLAQTGPPASLGVCLLLVDPGILTVSAATADVTAAQASLLLWDERDTTRRSSVDLTFPTPVPTTYISTAAPTPAELLLLDDVTATTHLDRPVAADGGRLAMQSSSATVAYVELAGATTVFVLAPIPYPANGPAPSPTTIALRNLFLKTTAPLGFLVTGPATATGTDLALDGGFVLVTFARLLAIPMLPDPYASNFDFGDTRSRTTAASMTPSSTPTPNLAAIVSWPQPSDAATQMILLPTAAVSVQAHQPALGIRSRPVTPVETPSAGIAFLRPVEFVLQGPDPQTVRTELLNRFGELTSSGAEFFRLLDVSSNADQFGVALAVGGRSEDAAAGAPASNPGPIIKGLDLVAPANTIRVLTLPPFHWEPVRNVPNPDAGPFPDVLVSDSDGGPTRIGVNSVDLVAVAPLPATTGLVSYYNAPDTKAAVALNTALPFGMLALAELTSGHAFPFVSPGISLNQPNFAASAVTGGLQLAFVAGGLLGNEASRSFAGVTVQTRNGHDSSMPAVVHSVLGDEVDIIFNAEFSTTGSGQKVPVSRIDVSGYGASLFNDWRDPTADIAATSEVRFEATVGRTSYEVVQVKSIVYPWGFHVVRTITMQRTGGGGVFRRDSGWVATSDGVYDFTYHKGGATIDPGIVVHPGVIKALRAIRHIRDTTQIYTRTYQPGDPNNSNPDPSQPWTVSLAAIRFDTDVQVENVQTGANNLGHVPTPDVVGYVQLQPSGVPLTPGQLDDLVAAQGAAGGAVDCVFTVGASQLQMRTGSFAANRTETGGGSPQLAVAARGSVILPQTGQWSFTYRLSSETEPHALDPNAAIPLIQQNPVGGSEQPYLFADPVDLFQPATPAAEYGILQSSDTQRLLVRAPRIQPGQTAVTSTDAFLLADVYALAGSVALFPREDLCIPMPDNCSLQVPAAAQLRLVIPPQGGVPANSFIVGTPAERIVTAANSGLTVHVVYADETAAKTVVTWSIDSTATPDWSFAMGPVSVLGDVGSFPGLMRVVGTLSAANGSAPQLQTPRLLFGGALSPVQDIINILTAIGIPIALSFALTSSTRKIQSGAILAIPPIKPKPGGGVEEGHIDIGAGKLKGELKTGFGNAAADGDTLFAAMENWRLYFELSGDLQVAIIPDLLFAGGTFKFQIEAQANQPTEITLMAGVILSVGGDLITDVLSVEGSVSYSYALQFKGSQTGFGIDIELKASASVLHGLAEVEISAEAMALATRIDNDTVHVDVQLSLGFEVTLGWVFNESFQVQAEYEKDLSMPVFVAAALLAA
jgi:hypothetical protein